MAVSEAEMRRSVASFRRALEDQRAVVTRLRTLPGIPNVPAAIRWAEESLRTIHETAAPVFEAVAAMDRSKEGRANG